MAEQESKIKRFFINVAKSLIDPKQYAVIGAEMRRGLKDLQDVVFQAFPSSMKSRDEAGTIGNPTQHQVTATIMGKNITQDKSPKQSLVQQLRGHVQQKAKEAEVRMDKGHQKERGGKEL